MVTKKTINEADDCIDCGGSVKANGRDKDGVMTYVCDECKQIYYDEREL